MALNTSMIHLNFLKKLHIVEISHNFHKFLIKGFMAVTTFEIMASLKFENFVVRSGFRLLAWLSHVPPLIKVQSITDSWSKIHFGLSILDHQL